MHSQDEGRDDKKPGRVVGVGCLSGLQLRNMPGNGSVVAAFTKGNKATK
jgi:hypothetical protein